MSKSELLEKTNLVLEKMQESAVLEVFHFAEYLLQKTAEPVSSKEFTKLMANGSSYDFLENEPDLYSLKDCVEVYKR